MLLKTVRSPSHRHTTADRSLSCHDDSSDATGVPSDTNAELNMPQAQHISSQFRSSTTAVIPCTAVYSLLHRRSHVHRANAASVFARHHPLPLKTDKLTFCSMPRTHQRASTRAKLVKNLRSAAQALAALQARQEQQSASNQAGGALGVVHPEGGAVPPLLIKGNTTEAAAVCLALEQCLFHRIRVKEFGEKFFISNFEYL